jgi:hypothetical protein
LCFFAIFRKQTIVIRRPGCPFCREEVRIIDDHRDLIEKEMVRTTKRFLNNRKLLQKKWEENQPLRFLFFFFLLVLNNNITGIPNCCCPARETRCCYLQA